MENFKFPFHIPTGEGVETVSGGRGWGFGTATKSIPVASFVLQPATFSMGTYHSSTPREDEAESEKWEMDDSSRFRSSTLTLLEVESGGWCTVGDGEISISISIAETHIQAPPCPHQPRYKTDG